jgi:hypothetical protein
MSRKLPPSYKLGPLLLNKVKNVVAACNDLLQTVDTTVSAAPQVPVQEQVVSVQEELAPQVVPEVVVPEVVVAPAQEELAPEEVVQEQAPASQLGPGIGIQLSNGSQIAYDRLITILQNMTDPRINKAKVPQEKVREVLAKLKNARTIVEAQNIAMEHNITLNGPNKPHFFRMVGGTRKCRRMHKRNKTQHKKAKTNKRKNKAGKRK